MVQNKHILFSNMSSYYNYVMSLDLPYNEKKMLIRDKFAKMFANVFIDTGVRRGQSDPKDLARLGKTFNPLVQFDFKFDSSIQSLGIGNKGLDVRDSFVDFKSVTELEDSRLPDTDALDDIRERLYDVDWDDMNQLPIISAFRNALTRKLLLEMD